MAQTRTRIESSVKFGPNAYPTRFVNIEGDRKNFHRVVVKGIGQKFILPTENGTFCPAETPRSDLMTNFEGRTPKEVWLKLAQHITETGAMPTEGQRQRKARAVKEVQTRKMVAKKTPSKKGQVVKKTRRSKDEFDFENMSSAM